MSGRFQIECYLLGPFCKPASVVSLPGQLGPEERVVVVNVQQGFFPDSLALALALDTVDKTIDATTGRGRR